MRDDRWDYKTYGEYYEAMRKHGAEFETYVENIFQTHRGHGLMSFVGQREQLAGENKAGFEIKLDRIFAQSGRLWIECYEKSDENNLTYVPSGIFRRDN